VVIVVLVRKLSVAKNTIRQFGRSGSRHEGPGKSLKTEKAIGQKTEPKNEDRPRNPE
jgi:hypothetical protein